MCEWVSLIQACITFCRFISYLDISGSIALEEVGVDLGNLDVHTSQVYNQRWEGLWEVVALWVVAS